MSCGNGTNVFSPSPDADPRLFLPHFLRQGSTAACIGILIVGVFGNLLVPYVVYRTRELRSSTNFLLINLCVADLLVLLVCMPTVLLELFSKPEVWELGALMCKVVPYLELTVAHGSVFTILAISLERYYAICRPLKAMTKCTKPRAAYIVTIVWLCASTLTSPVLAIAQYQLVPHVDGSQVPACLTLAASGSWQKTYFVSIIVVFFWFPVLVLVLLYAIITRHLMSKGELLQVGNGKGNSRMKSRRQVVIMLTCVVACFFTCLMPFRVFTLWLLLSSTKHVQALGMDTYYAILYFCRVMLYVNSAVNPVLYNLISSKFRTALLRIIMCGATEASLIRQGTGSTTYTSHNSTKVGLSRSVEPVTVTAATLATGKRIAVVRERLEHEDVDKDSGASCI